MRFLQFVVEKNRSAIVKSTYLMKNEYTTYILYPTSKNAAKKNRIFNIIDFIALRAGILQIKATRNGSNLDIAM